MAARIKETAMGKSITAAEGQHPENHQHFPDPAFKHQQESQLGFQMYERKQGYHEGKDDAQGQVGHVKVDMVCQDIRIYFVYPLFNTKGLLV